MDSEVVKKWNLPADYERTNFAYIICKTNRSSFQTKTAVPSNEKIINYIINSWLQTSNSSVNTSKNKVIAKSCKKIQTHVMNLQFWNFMHHKRHILYLFTISNLFQHVSNNFFKF